MDHIFATIRHLILFGLGVAVILDAVITPGNHVGELATGLILLGIVPIDFYLTARR